MLGPLVMLVMFAGLVVSTAAMLMILGYALHQAMNTSLAFATGIAIGGIVMALVWWQADIKHDRGGWRIPGPPMIDLERGLIAVELRQ